MRPFLPRPLRTRSTPLAVGLFGLLCGVALLSSGMPVPPQRPNVLLVVLDDLGIEKLGFYAYNPAGLGCSGAVGPRPTPPTPRLAAIAQAGVRFSQAYANPVCSSTRATILTGRLAFRTGMGSLADADDFTLGLNEVTIAEVLKYGLVDGTQPYRRGAFGKWHLAGPQDYTHPVQQGFGRFVGTLANIGRSHFGWTLVRADASGYSLAPIGSRAGPFDESSYSASVVRREAAAWINASSAPFFAYVCFHPPHAPFQVPPFTTLSAATQAEIDALEALAPGTQYAEGQDLGGTPDARRAFDWMIESVDTELGRLIDAIAPDKRANTTILIVGDNGTPGQVIQPPYRPGHAKGSAFQQGVRVPFLAQGHGVNGAGRSYDGLVSTVDLWRTIAAITGSALPSGLVHDSVNLQDVLKDPRATSPRTKAFAQHFRPAGPYDPDPLADPDMTYHWRSMSDGRFTYMRFGTTANPAEAAFRLGSDPTECHDVWANLGALTFAEQVQILGLKEALIELSGL